jgi:hypothetical protein
MRFLETVADVLGKCKAVGVQVTDCKGGAGPADDLRSVCRNGTDFPIRKGITYCKKLTC